VKIKYRRIQEYSEAFFNQRKLAETHLRAGVSARGRPSWSSLKLSSDTYLEINAKAPNVVQGVTKSVLSAVLSANSKPGLPSLQYRPCDHKYTSPRKQ
jgi:hypothetical protein